MIIAQQGGGGGQLSLEAAQCSQFILFGVWKIWYWLRLVLAHFPMSDDTVNFDEPEKILHVVEEYLECLMIGAAEVKYSQRTVLTA